MFYDAFSNTYMQGFFEKRRLRSFVMYVQDYEADKPATHKVCGICRNKAQQLIVFAFEIGCAGL